MKKVATIITVSLFLSIIVLLLTGLDFLALSDIKSDYLSQKMIDTYQLTSVQEIPDWTSTKGEWWAVSISLLIRLSFLVFNIIAMVHIFKKIDPEKKTS